MRRWEGTGEKGKWKQGGVGESGKKEERMRRTTGKRKRENYYTVILHLTLPENQVPRRAMEGSGQGARGAQGPHRGRSPPLPTHPEAGWASE